MDVPKSDVKNIGVFSPNFQGPFQGEIANQIRQLCAINGYRFIGFSTIQFGEYQLPLGLDHLDGAILIRNAISRDLAETLVSKNIPVVSIAYDYFPLNIPLVSCNHFQGVELAIEYLIGKGHKKIAYIGDLKNFDLRKRYEAFCDITECYGLEESENCLYTVDDTDLESGYQAGREFRARGEDISAVLCGAGLTGIGFALSLQSDEKFLGKAPDIVMFDAIPITPVLSDSIAVVDQNVLLMAHKAMSVIDCVSKEKEVKRVNQITPKLILPSSQSEGNRDAYLATCVELSSLYNPNYLKTALANMFEWSLAIDQSQLDKIMTIAPFFSNLMGFCVLSKVKINNLGERVIEVQKKYNLDDVTQYSFDQENALHLLADFPASFVSTMSDDYGALFHFPIIVKKEIWGIFSVFGRNDPSPKIPSNFFLFDNQIEIAVKNMSTRLELQFLVGEDEDPEKSKNKREDDSKWQKGHISWDLKSDTYTWSNEILEALGFSSPIEKNIYKNMEIYDRIDESMCSDLADQINLFSADSHQVSCVGKIKDRFSHLRKIKIKLRSDSEDSGSEMIQFSVFVAGK